MRFLFLNQTTVEYDPVVYSLGSLLSKDDHEVVCIGYSNSKSNTEKIINKRFKIIKVFRGNYGWAPRTLRGFFRYYKYIYFCKKFGKMFNPNSIVAFNYDTLQVGAMIKIFTSSKLVYYCTEYTAKPKLFDYFIGWGFVKKMERLWLNYIDLLISVDEQRAIIQSNEWKKPKPSVIINSPLYDPDIEHTSLNFIKKIKVPVKIIYAGSIAQRNCFEQLFDALNLVNCPLVFDIFGPIRPEFNDTFERGLTKLKRNKAIKINYKGVLEYQKIAKEFPMYDVGLVLYDGKDPNTAMAAPAKLFEYMKAGLGIISTSQPGPRNIIKKVKCGWLVNPNDTESLASTFEEMGKSLDEVKRVRLSSLNAFRNEFCYDKQVVPLLDWIKNN